MEKQLAGIKELLREFVFCLETEYLDLDLNDIESKIFGIISSIKPKPQELQPQSSEID